MKIGFRFRKTNRWSIQIVLAVCYSFQCMRLKWRRNPANLCLSPKLNVSMPSIKLPRKSYHLFYFVLFSRIINLNRLISEFVYFSWWFLFFLFISKSVLPSYFDRYQNLKKKCALFTLWKFCALICIGSYVNRTIDKITTGVKKRESILHLFKAEPILALS